MDWRVRPNSDASNRLIKIALRSAFALDFRRGSLSVAVVGKTRMSALHRLHCGVPGPTDVITFDYGSRRNAGYLDGEIIVCADVAAAQSGGPRSGRRFITELSLYLIHGMLHLAGYDDTTPAAFRALHRREDQLLRRMGMKAARIHQAPPRT